MKKILALLLSLVMLLSLLCACSKEEEKETSDIKPLRKEIVEAYETDEKIAKEVHALINEFNKAFEKLTAGTVDDAAFLAYAQSVDRVVHDFEAFDAYKDNITGKSEYLDLQLAQLELLNIRANLHGKLYDYESGEASAESCAEAAFGVVNSYSEFFYGEYLFTDDDLDKLG